MSVLHFYGLSDDEEKCSDYDCDWRVTNLREREPSFLSFPLTLDMRNEQIFRLSPFFF